MTLTYEPVVSGSVEVKVAGTTVATDTAGVITGTGITGTVNLTTGAISVTWTTAPAAAAAITVLYKADIENATDNYLREIDVGVTILPVTAQEHPLRMRWSEQGRILAMTSPTNFDIDDVITQTAGLFMKIEKDRNVINVIRTAAGTYNAELAFDATQPAAGGITLKQHFADFAIKVSKGSGIIYTAAGRGEVSWVICGTEASTVIEAVSGFVPEPNVVPIGAHVIGTLGGKTLVIKDGGLPTGEFIFGFNGTLVGDAGIIIADFIPIYFTPTLVTSDLKGSKAMLSMYDQVVNNGNYYIRGVITNV